MKVLTGVISTIGSIAVIFTIIFSLIKYPETFERSNEMAIILGIMMICSFTVYYAFKATFWRYKHKDLAKLKMEIEILKKQVEKSELEIS